MGRIGLPELLIVLAVILLFFGARKLPDLARSLGRSLGEFKKGRSEGENGIAKQANANVKADSDKDLKKTQADQDKSEV